MKYVKPELIPLNVNTASGRCYAGNGDANGRCAFGSAISRVHYAPGSCALGRSETGSCTLGGRGQYS